MTHTANTTTTKKRASWVVGNWKMNPSQLADASQLYQQIHQGVASAPHGATKVMLGIAPTLLHLGQLEKYAPNADICLFAQDVAAHDADTGAYTGDVSAAMLKNIGVTGALVGHSERRAYHNECNNALTQKMVNLLNQDMRAIFCIGETLEQREAGDAKTVAAEQLAALFAAFKQVSASPKQLVERVLVAYEPVWAIGTGLSASCDDAADMHAFIRQNLQQQHTDLADIALLYGGSVKPDNAATFAALADVDGVLVGGASLNAQQYLDIVQSFR